MKDLIEQQLKEFDDKFPSYLSLVCPFDGKPVPDYNGWWLFQTYKERKNIPLEILSWHTKSIHEVIDKVVEKIYTKMDEYEFHKDEIHCTCLGALREDLKQHLLSIKE